jgi:hypothetical protein
LLLSKPVIVQASCVHVDVNAANVSCAVRDRRNDPAELRTIVAPPTVASGEVESICTTTVLPLVLPLMTASCGAVSCRLVGLVPPPPHASMSEPSATHDATWQA